MALALSIDRGIRGEVGAGHLLAILREHGWFRKETTRLLMVAHSEPKIYGTVWIYSPSVCGWTLAI
jgi:hypothetical protein